jgi:flagellar hook-associated protein 3 FlgL
MAITRVTQQMLSQRSLASIMGGLSQMAKYQEQLETGKKLNRPSDDAAGTNTALRMRTALAEQDQYVRNANDGKGWLSTVDSTLSGVVTQLQRANTLALQGANDGAMSQSAAEALATEIDQIRESLLQQANSDYLGRPVFGGTTAGSVAFDANGNYVGDGGEVTRRVGSGVSVRVDSDGRTVFGEDGDNVFSHLSALSAALRNGSDIQTSIDQLQTDVTRISAAQADEGARLNRLTQASDLASQAQLRLKSSLSDVEDVELAEVTINVNQAEIAYKAALAAAAKTLQPSLLDFLK